jgi:Ig-like domain from next to BRCA1 gene
LLIASAIIRRVPTRRKLSRDWPVQAVAIVVGLCLALAGCSTTTGTPTPGLAPNSASPTAPVLPVITNTPIPPSTDTPTATLAEAASASETPAVSLATGTPTPTPTGPCTNNAHFVADLTVPDGTQYLPGQPIDKQWRVKNTGTCDWGADYRLVLVSGNAMGAPSEVALYPAKGGSGAVLDLNMTAPAEPGVYTGRWQARSPTAKLFGDRVFVTINVVAITATVTITATP